MRESSALVSSASSANLDSWRSVASLSRASAALSYSTATRWSSAFVASASSASSASWRSVAASTVGRAGARRVLPALGGWVRAVTAEEASRARGASSAEDRRAFSTRTRRLRRVCRSPGRVQGTADFCRTFDDLTRGSVRPGAAPAHPSTGFEQRTSCCPITHRSCVASKPIGSCRRSLRDASAPS